MSDSIILNITDIDLTNSVTGDQAWPATRSRVDFGKYTGSECR